VKNSTPVTGSACVSKAAKPGPCRPLLATGKNSRKLQHMHQVLMTFLSFEKGSSTHRLILSKTIFGKYATPKVIEPNNRTDCAVISYNQRYAYNVLKPRQTNPN